jgi:ubiquinone/menaquinone biosynthesis C-methylase UbiE
MKTEQQVARHYTHGALEEAILSGLTAAGKEIGKLTPDDLAPVDEFHLGWRAATAELAKDLAFTRAMHVLDVGCGIGGPARYFAHTAGCRVTGIDLTDEFVAVAAALTKRCGLGDRAAFRQASALALPFTDQSFDGAMMLHVGMNIADKAKVFAEVRRVLKPGALFCVYDVMRAGAGDIPYPMPWAASAETSFVETPATYRKLLEAAGFAIAVEKDRGELAKTLGRKMREDAAKFGPPPLGLHTLMGPEAKPRFANVFATLEAGVIAPTEILARVK